MSNLQKFINAYQLHIEREIAVHQTCDLTLFGAGHVVTPRVAIIANVSLVNGHRVVESE